LWPKVRCAATASGRRVLVPELNPGTFGFSAIVIDSEGNNIGLISYEA